MPLLKDIKDIIVFMPRFFGDCINCTPALQLIQQYYPGCKIYLVIRQETACIFEHESNIECIYDPRPKNKLKGTIELVRQLRTINSDASILMTNKFFDALITFFAGIPVRVGYKTEQRSSLLTHGLFFDRSRHYINRYAYLANALCNNSFKKLPPVSIKFNKNKSQLNDRAGFKIGFCILGGGKVSRHYPPNQVVKVIAQLVNSVEEELHFFMLGAPDEVEEAELVSLKCKKTGLNRVESLAGTTCVIGLIDDIAALDLLISVDSGPLHMAAVTGTPTVALHSKGTSPFSIVCPKSHLVEVVNSRGGYINDNDQVLDLLPEDIASAALKLIKNINK